MVVRNVLLLNLVLTLVVCGGNWPRANTELALLSTRVTSNGDHSIVHVRWYERTQTNKHGEHDEMQDLRVVTRTDGDRLACREESSAAKPSEADQTWKCAFHEPSQSATQEGEPQSDVEAIVLQVGRGGARDVKSCEKLAAGRAATFAQGSRGTLEDEYRRWPCEITLWQRSNVSVTRIEAETGVPHFASNAASLFGSESLVHLRSGEEGSEHTSFVDVSLVLESDSENSYIELADVRLTKRDKGEHDERGFSVVKWLYNPGVKLVSLQLKDDLLREGPQLVSLFVDIRDELGVRTLKWSGFVDAQYKNTANTLQGDVKYISAQKGAKDACLIAGTLGLSLSSVPDDPIQTFNAIASDKQWLSPQHPKVMRCIQSASSGDNDIPSNSSVGMLSVNFIEVAPNPEGPDASREYLIISVHNHLDRPVEWKQPLALISQNLAVNVELDEAIVINAGESTSLMLVQSLNTLPESLVDADYYVEVPSLRVPNKVRALWLTNSSCKGNHDECEVFAAIMPNLVDYDQAIPNDARWRAMISSSPIRQKWCLTRSMSEILRESDCLALAGGF